MLVLFLVFSCVRLLSAGGLDLPSYIPKCALSDPDLFQCIVRSANAIIPRLIQGDLQLAIPPLSPLRFSEMSMRGDDLEMQWFDVYSDDLKNIRMTNVVLILGGVGSFDGYLNRFTIIGKNYNILGGNVIGIPAYGNGSFEITLVGVEFKLINRLSTYQRAGDTYLNVIPEGVETNITRAYYHFENIRSPCVDDVNAYIEEHWEEFTRQISPAINTQLGAFTNYPIHMVTTKVPLNVIYLP